VVALLFPCAHRLSLNARLVNTALKIPTQLVHLQSEIVLSAISVLLVLPRSCLANQVRLVLLLDSQPLIRSVKLVTTASEERSLMSLPSPLKEVVA